MSKEDKERKRAEREAQGANPPDATTGFIPPQADIQDQKPYPEEKETLSGNPFIHVLRDGKLEVGILVHHDLSNNSYTAAVFPAVHNAMVKDPVFGREVPAFIPLEIAGLSHASDVPKDRELTAHQFVHVGEDTSIIRNRALEYEKQHQAKTPTVDVSE